MGKKLSKEQREEVVRRCLAGETQVRVAEDFGITRQYVSLIVRAVKHPEEAERRAERKLKKRLTPEQEEELKTTIETSLPNDHEIFPSRGFWTVEHGIELAEKRFGKTPSKAVVEQIVKPLAEKRRRERPADPRPEPPKPFDVRNLSPELADNEAFIAYCSSPIGRQVAQREYEIRLKEWEKRQAKREEKAEMESEFPARPFPGKLPGKRTGKHAGGRGSKFTPKRKKRKR